MILLEKGRRARAICREGFTGKRIRNLMTILALPLGARLVRFAGGTRLVFGQSWRSAKGQRFQLVGCPNIPRVAELRGALNVLRPSLPLAVQAWQLTPAPPRLV